jgi:hypothetical protein
MLSRGAPELRRAETESANFKALAVDSMLFLTASS